MKVLLKVPLNVQSGYGTDGCDMALAFMQAGADVYLDPTAVQPPLTPAVAELLTKRLDGPFDLYVHHVDPGQLGIGEGARRASAITLAHTMWEYTTLDNCRGRSTLRKRLKSYDLVVGYDAVSSGALAPYVSTNLATVQGGYWPQKWPGRPRDWNNTLNFCMVGALGPRKDPFVAIDAFKELRAEHPGLDIALHIKTVTPGLHSRLMDVVPGLKIYYEMWPEDVLRDFYYSQHVLLAPSRGEGKNLPALEMLSTGGTVMATNFGGHALALSTPLPTPSGWTTMGEVGVGSVLLDDQGKPCAVTAKSAIRYDDTYRVTFSDGSDVLASEGHLWQVSLDGGEKVMSTAEIQGWMLTSKARYNPKLPTVPPIDFPEVELPVDPYVLGLWLADGEADGGRITSGRQDVEETTKHLSVDSNVLSVTYVKSEYGEGFRIYVEGLKPALRALGVRNNKHIPAVYLRAGLEQRLNLLRGLMDGDGTISARGQCFFDNTDKRLLAGVAELARTLGIKVTRSRIGYEGQRRLSFYTDLIVFKLERKVARQLDYGHVASRSRTRTIRRIEKVLTVPTQCVTVDSPSSLFLCGEGFVPTHNSQWLSSMIGYPLNYTLGPVKGDLPDCLWAKADKEHLKQLMLYAYHNRAELARKGELAAELIPSMCSWSKVLDRLMDRVAKVSETGERVVHKYRVAKERVQQEQAVVSLL